MKDYLKKLGIKVIKTMSETAIALIGTSVFITDVDWIAILSATALSGVVTVLMNLKELEE